MPMKIAVYKIHGEDSLLDDAVVGVDVVRKVSLATLHQGIIISILNDIKVN
jgi:hypothetical protein